MLASARDCEACRAIISERPILFLHPPCELAHGCRVHSDFSLFQSGERRSGTAPWAANPAVLRASKDLGARSTGPISWWHDLGQRQRRYAPDRSWSPPRPTDGSISS
eukprot:scaffold442_cov123-Isochrysis_galbana.AAC.1